MSVRHVREDCGICFLILAVTGASTMNCLLCAGSGDGLDAEDGEYRGFIPTDPSIQTYFSVSGAAQCGWGSVNQSNAVLVSQEPGLWKKINSLTNTHCVSSSKRIAISSTTLSTEYASGVARAKGMGDVNLDEVGVR